jgi:ketosteroid isomerase-like protein
MTSQTIEQVRELGRRWAQAEQRADVAALDAMSTADFTVVGPVGFVLDKAQWLDRYRSGALVIQAITWDDVEIRDYGDSAVAVGVHDQKARHHGKPAGGRFRATHIAVRDQHGDWRLAGVHLSSIGGLPAATQSAPG